MEVLYEKILFIILAIILGSGIQIFSGQAKQAEKVCIEKEKIEKSYVGNLDYYEAFLTIGPDTSEEEIIEAFGGKENLFADDSSYFIEYFNQEKPIPERIIYSDYTESDFDDNAGKSKEQYYLVYNNVEETRDIYDKIKGAKSLEEMERVSGYRPILQKIAWDKNGKVNYYEYCYQGLDGNRVVIYLDGDRQLDRLEYFDYSY